MNRSAPKRLAPVPLVFMAMNHFSGEYVFLERSPLLWQTDSQERGALMHTFNVSDMSLPGEFLKPLPGDSSF